MLFLTININNAFRSFKTKFGGISILKKSTTVNVYVFLYTSMKNISYKMREWYNVKQNRASVIFF